MICKNCGKEISDQSKFCPQCGTPVKQPENILKSQNEQISPVCAGCGQPLKPGSKFCFKCGLKVGESPSVSGDTEYLAPEEYGDETEVLIPQGERYRGEYASPLPPPMTAPSVPPMVSPPQPVKKKSRTGLFIGLAAVFFIAACAVGICISLFVMPMVKGESNPLFNQKAGIVDEIEDTEETETTDEGDSEEETESAEETDSEEGSQSSETMESDSTEPVFGIKQS